MTILIASFSAHSRYCEIKLTLKLWDKTMSLPDNQLPDDDQRLSSVDEVVELDEDVYERIVRQVQEINQAIEQEKHNDSLCTTSPVESNQSGSVPQPPASMSEAGLSLGLISDLVLKLVYLHGSLTGYDVAAHLRLPFSVLDKPLEFLTTDRCLEVTSGDMVGRISYRFQLTDHGRSRARHAFEDCRYVGPAPVSLSEYLRVTTQQAVRNIDFNGSALQQAFQDLIITETQLEALGPAVCGGQSMLLYGPPGNGKTVLARAVAHFLNQSGGTVYVPYAFTVDQHIITVFDPTVHQTVSVDSDLEYDQRWQPVARPVVIAGGELTMSMLDLTLNETGRFSTAPLHVKANGGVFLLDDFGRQLVPPRELLNRWIMPLEERKDYLTLPTGKSFPVPFEQLTIFSTNISPNELVDQAFLRRIRYKIEVGPPSEQQYREIFQLECEKRKIKYDDWLVTRILTSMYNPQNPPKSSDPRDLLDVVEGICRFKGQSLHLSEELICIAFERCLRGTILTDA